MSYNTLMEQTAVKIRASIQQFDFDKHKDLTTIMNLFDRLKLKEGYVLDAITIGSQMDSYTQLYAKRGDATEEFVVPLDFFEDDII